MMKLLGYVSLLAGLGTSLLWWVGSRAPAWRLARGKGPVWMVALRLRATCDGEWRELLRDGIAVCWAGAADLPLIGSDAPYWDRFAILQGGEPQASPLKSDASLADAQVLRIQLVRPARLVLGLLRALHVTGLRRMPKGHIDPQTLAASVGRPDIAPNVAAMRALLERPHDQQPVMVNYLAYRDTADYPGASREHGSGSAAYGRYGRVALQTVYRTGGALMFYGKVAAVLREPHSGPTAGPWHEVAAMRYSQPTALLAMEQVETYRAALRDRDAGLERTVVVATLTEPNSAATNPP